MYSGPLLLRPLQKKGLAVSLMTKPSETYVKLHLGVVGVQSSKLLFKGAPRGLSAIKSM